MYREEDYNRQYDDDRAVAPKMPYDAGGHGSRRVGNEHDGGAHYPKAKTRGPAEEERYGNRPPRGRSPRSGPPQRSGGKNRRGKKAVKFVVAILVILGLLFGGAYLYLAATLNTQDFPTDDASLGITGNSTIGITNIAFFGVDTRDNTDTGRSDAILILTVDTIHSQIKMTSILRDSKVPIEGHGETKINHAYAYGGPELAVKTLNQVFNLDIREYATVNFNQLSEIVDAVGGVTLPISDEEVKAINALMDEAFPGGEHLAASGDVLLNGEQAICYSRIRKIDTDNARAGRQQAVLNAVFESLKSMNKLEYPSFIRKFSAIVDTSLSAGNIMKLSPIMFENFQIIQNTIPDEQYETDLRGGIDSDGIWYWHYDLDKAAARLHQIIYGSNE